MRTTARVREHEGASAEGGINDVLVHDREMPIGQYEDVILLSSASL
jgi:hypothetical protein